MADLELDFFLNFGGHLVTLRKNEAIDNARLLPTVEVKTGRLSNPCFTATLHPERSVELQPDSVPSCTEQPGGATLLTRLTGFSGRAYPEVLSKLSQQRLKPRLAADGIQI